MAEASNIPRWARDFEATVWERINELLADGWDTPDIMRELGLPKSKLRSLQQLARKYGPRRRLTLFARFKDALMRGAADLGPDFAKAMTLIAANAVSENVKDSTQHKACELITDFTKAITKMAAIEAEFVEAESKDAETQHDKGKALSADAIASIKNVYGVGDAHGHG